MAWRGGQHKREEQVDTWGQVQDFARERQQQVALSARPMREYAQLIPEPGFGPLDFDRFPYQQAWYSPEVADAEEVVWIKSTQVGMCLGPDTRVLTAGLSWVPISDVAVGDELVAVDEQGTAPGGIRKMRTATVRARWDTERPSLRIMFEDGASLVCSGEHRWLCQHGTARERLRWAWIAAGDLRVGDCVRRVVQPWEVASAEDGWMGGLLDGEGCLNRREPIIGRGTQPARLTITQSPGAVLDRARAYLAERGYAAAEGRKQAQLGSETATLTLMRADEILRLLGVTQPTRWRFDWWSGQRVFSPRGETAARIAAIEPVGDCGLVDIETSTGTFIAEGFVSHNSAYAWRWGVRRADQFGETVVYIFPAEKHVRDFGDERIEPAIAESVYLRARIQARYVRHKSLKRIGRGFLHLRGSNSKAGAQSVAAQALVFDEYDHLDQVNLPQIERRITGAQQLGKRPRTRRLGTPTLEGFGIAAAWEGSDQRVWIVTCGECGHEQQITWEESMRWRTSPGGKVCRAGRDDEFEDPKEVAEVWRECGRCGESLERDIAGGRWVAQKPGRKVIGFHATRLIVPVTNLAQIVEASRKTVEAEVIAFENNDLGRPYSAAGAQLDMPSLLAACELGGPRVEAYTGIHAVTMGVDVAGERDLSVRIDEQLPAEHPAIPNPRRALWIGEVSSFEEVVRMIDRFRVSVCVVDDNPERRMAKALRAHFTPGRVVLCEYAVYVSREPETMKIQTGEPNTPLDGVPLTVQVHRTEAIDAMMDSIRQLRNLPLRDPPPRWFDQMRALKRITELDTKGRPRRVYITTGTQGDDYAHADVYALIATELWRLRGGAQAMVPQDRALPDEELGFSRVRLSVDNPGIYRPGFGEDGLLQ